MQKLVLPLIIIAVLVLGLASFLSNRQTKESATQQEPPIPRSEIIVDKDGFSPQTLTVKKGDTVVWINQSGGAVTVNSDPHPTHNKNRFLNRGEFASGSSVQVTFVAAGTYGYHNHFNPSQKGTIIVQ